MLAALCVLCIFDLVLREELAVLAQCTLQVTFPVVCCAVAWMDRQCLPLQLSAGDVQGYVMRFASLIGILVCLGPGLWTFPA
jgi:hypothetical protein